MASSAMGSATRPSSAAVSSIVAAVAAFVPIVAEWVYKVFRLPRPYWIQFYDPEVAYYIGGLRLLGGRLPPHVEHPGTPLHLLTAALLWLGGRREPFDIEWFRPIAYATAMALNLLAAALLAATVLRTVPALLRVAAIWSYFACASALQWNETWGPEILYFAAGALVLAAADRTLPAPSPRGGFLLGAAFGLCLALKLTFLAWLPALLIAGWIAAGPSPRRVASFLGAMLAGMLVGLALATFVIRARWIAVGSWIAGVLLRSGRYGSGDLAWPAPREVLGNLRAVVGSSKGVHLWWALSALVLLARFRRGDRDVRRRDSLALVALALMGMAIPYLSAARGAEVRYLLPAGLMGMLLFARAVDGWKPACTRPVQLAALAVMAILLGRTIAVDLVAHVRRVAEGRALNEAVRAAVARETARLRRAPIVVYGWRLPEPSFALRIESSEPEELQAICRRYPDSGHYDPWTRVVQLPAGRSSWDLLVVSPDDLRNFPERTGPMRERVDGYLVVAAPGG